MQQEIHLNCHALSPIALENTQIVLDSKCRREFSWTGHNLSPFANSFFCIPSPPKCQICPLAHGYMHFLGFTYQWAYSSPCQWVFSFF